MIMPRAAEKLLLPANPWFIAFSLIAALLIDMVPLGRVAAMPDVLAIVLVFWSVHQPRRVGVLWAFAFGLLIDVHDGAVLGQHALAYSALSCGAILMHRRLAWFTLRGQAVQLFPLFFAAHALAVLARMAAGGMWPGWSVLLAPVLEALLWPLFSALLLAPQRRAPDPDAHRPL